MLPERLLHQGQNHLFCNDKISGFRNWFVEVWMSADTGTVTISRFHLTQKNKSRYCKYLLIFCYKLNGLVLMLHLLTHLRKHEVFTPNLVQY